MDTETDKKLLGAVIEGDKNAFKCLFQKYYTTLCNFSLSYLDEIHEAEDAVQDVFVYIWNNRAVIDVQNSVKAYLFSSVKHRVLNILKHKAIERSHNHLFIEFLEEVATVEYSEEEQARLEQIKNVLQTLPTQCRTVFMMSCLEGKKYKEIAEELQISVNTVKSHILKAYRQIRKNVTGAELNSLLLFWVCKMYNSDRSVLFSK